MSYTDELIQVLQRLPAILPPLLPFIRDCQGTLWLAGNGGSASIAQHWACDLSKAAGRRVQALGSNGAVLTAWANDNSYDQALAKELESQARPGDQLILLSCSGRSPNILALMGLAKRLRIPHYLVTGRAAPTYPGVSALIVPHGDYGIIEDCFGAIGHWLTEALCNR